LLSRDGRIVHDVRVEAADPEQAADKALSDFRDRHVRAESGCPSHLMASL